MLVIHRAFIFIFFIIFLINICTGYVENEEDHVTISKYPDNVSPEQDQRYLLYEINFGEGFNLRRDVYMRVASLVKHLRKKGN